jgi:hypothetical protein
MGQLWPGSVATVNEPAWMSGRCGGVFRQVLACRDCRDAWTVRNGDADGFLMMTVSESLYTATI